MTSPDDARLEAEPVAERHTDGCVVLAADRRARLVLGGLCALCRRAASPGPDCSRQRVRRLIRGSDLVPFLEELASGYQGWDGERSWHTKDRDPGTWGVAAVFRPGGNVGLTWTVRPWPQSVGGWSASVTTWLEGAEQMATLAAGIRRFLTGEQQGDNLHPLHLNAGGMEARRGPWQVTVAPSPVARPHRTLRAFTVTVTPPVVAEAVAGWHVVGVLVAPLHIGIPVHYGPAARGPRGFGPFRRVDVSTW